MTESSIKNYSDVFEAAKKIAMRLPVQMTMNNMAAPLHTNHICLGVDVTRIFDKLRRQILEDARRCQLYVDSLGGNRQYEKRLVTSRMGSVSGTIKSAVIVFDAMDIGAFRLTEYEVIRDFVEAVCYVVGEMESANIVVSLDEVSFDMPSISMVSGMSLYLSQQECKYQDQKRARSMEQLRAEMLRSKVLK